MISKTGKDFDIILITSEYYDDHPSSPSGVIARVLDAKGFKVGILERPVSNEDFLSLGTPKLFFGITSGTVDSMVNNYTPLKKKRVEDEYNRSYEMPDRAVIFYCNKLKQFFKGSKLVIGGIESSLRRFAHYDYWDNNIRRSILLDSRADILVYGNGEKQVIEIAQKLQDGKDIKGILGTCIVSKELSEGFELLPSITQVKEDKHEFMLMQKTLSNKKNLAQKYDNNYVLQYKFPKYTSEDLDWIYSLNYARTLHPKSLLKMARFTITTHRGCFGSCNFCSIALHQGDKIISRSEENILDEIRKITKHPDFKGFIDDLGGPSANMYGSDCTLSYLCQKKCLKCSRLDKSHSRILNLLREARQIPGVKKVFVRSGIRYDLAIENKDYIDEISKYHISGTLKIAPEHISPKVLNLMNKNVNEKLDSFVKYFNQTNTNAKQYLTYYFMIGHPGDSIESVKQLKSRMDKLKVESFQLFTPTPMSNSTAMYYAGTDLEFSPIKIIYDYNTKKQLKRIIFGEQPEKKSDGYLL